MALQTQAAPAYAPAGTPGWFWDDAACEFVPVSGNNPADLTRGIGRLTALGIGAAAATPSRALVNQLLPPGILFVAGANGPETNTYTSRVSITPTALLRAFNQASFGGSFVANTIPAGALNLVGRTLRFRATGTLGSTGTPNLTVDLALGAAGANVVATTGVLAMATATTPAPWTLDCTATVQTAGASGAIISEGIFQYSTTSSVIVLPWTMGNSTRGTALTPVDLTAAQLFTINATCSASSASNRIIVNTLTIEILY